MKLINQLENIKNKMKGKINNFVSLVIFLSCFTLGYSKIFSEKDLKQILIAGGTKATAGEIPYVVSFNIYTETQSFCGGTLINKDWILTAAHCFDQGTKLADIL